MKTLRFSMSPEYNEFDGSWWLSSINEGPIEVVIKVEAEEAVAKRVARKIESSLKVSLQGLPKT